MTRFDLLILIGQIERLDGCIKHLQEFERFNRSSVCPSLH
jgi:hypothetical protein